MPHHPKSFYIKSLLALPVLLSLTTTAGAKDKPPKPVEIPYDIHVAKVAKGKLPAFFDAEHLNRSPVLSAASAVLIDADTGQVLWGKNQDLRRAPASTTKILTALLFIENTTPDEIVTCNDASVTKIVESSLHIKPGEKFRAEQLLYGMMLRSGNDAAVVMAQHVGGSVAGFAQLMNKRAQELGAVNSNWVTPNGLNAPSHYATALDLARIARVAMQNPRFVEAVRLPRRTIERSINKGDRTITARSTREFIAKFPGADGIKSGYTRQARRCYVGTATRDGRRLLSVVLGCEGAAIADTVALQGWGFRRFPKMVVVAQNALAGTVSLPNAAEGIIPTVAARDLQVSVDSLEAAPQITTEIYPLENLSAPVTRGQEVGTIIAKQNGIAIAQVPLLAADDVAAAPAPVAALRHMTAGASGSSGSNWMWPGIGISALLLVAWSYGYRFKQTRKTAPSKAARVRKEADSQRRFAPATAKSNCVGRDRFAPRGGGNDRRRPG